MPPIATPNPAKPAQIAMARGRSAGGNTWARIDSVAGITKAAPTPIAARAPITAPDEFDSTANNDAAPKTIRPPLSASRRPKRSPRLPAVRSRPANTRLYASTSHCSPLALACRSLASVGSAVLRLAFAMTISTRLMQRTPRVHQRRSYSRALACCARSSSCSNSDSWGRAVSCSMLIERLQQGGGADVSGNRGNSPGFSRRRSGRRNSTSANASV